MRVNCYPISHMKVLRVSEVRLPDCKACATPAKNTTIKSL